MDAFLRRVLAQREQEREAMMTKAPAEAGLVAPRVTHCACGVRLQLSRRVAGLCGGCAEQHYRAAKRERREGMSLQVRRCNACGNLVLMAAKASVCRTCLVKYDVPQRGVR